MALGVLSGEFDRCTARDRGARPSGDGGRWGEGGIGHHHVNEIHRYLQRLGSHLRQDGRRALTNVDVADVHLDTPSRADTHFSLGLAPNAAFVDGQGHTHATAHVTSCRAMALVSLSPADAFGAGEDTLTESVAGEGHPTFDWFIRQELVVRCGALAWLTGACHMILQAVIEWIDAKSVSHLINQHF